MLLTIDEAKMMITATQDAADTTASDDEVLMLLRFVENPVWYRTRFWVYPTVNGQPEQEEVKEALVAAAKAQLGAVLKAGLLGAVLSGGVTVGKSLKASSANGASVTFDTSLADEATAGLLQGRLCPAAEAALVPPPPGVRTTVQVLY